MKITIVYDRGAYWDHYENVECTLIQHQKNNGDWLIIYFKKETPEYEKFKDQKGELPIAIDIKKDQILTY